MGASDFYKQKYAQEANKYWDMFYQRNETKFFKDRHWLESEFVELQQALASSKTIVVFMEVGCGVGNTSTQFKFF